MLVTRRNFDEILKVLAAKSVLGLDTETTCLNWWKNPWNPTTPRVFSVQFATEEQEYYFDFNHSDDRLGDAHFQKIHQELTQDPLRYWFIANAKFDMHHLANHGVLFSGNVHCTKAIARVVNNLEPSLSLDELGAKYLGVNKLDVISIIKERGHLTKIKKFGYNEKFEEILHFDRLELKELVDYGKKDTRLCYDIGIHQLTRVRDLDKEIFDKPNIKQRLSHVLYNEIKLTKVCFKMEREGILLDRAYTEKAYEHEVSEYNRIEGELDGLSKKYIDKKIDWLSAKQLKPLFEAMGEPYGYTEKGNACFDKEALEDSPSEVSKLILKYRYHNKRAHTYFENFLWLADTDNVIHTDLQPAGTGFGRMSCWNPNLQNVPKRADKEDGAYRVRNCFIPKPGTLFVDIDYAGAEYYMTIDYAREEKVIEQLKAGEDPHESLGISMQLKDRDTAKTMQFRILYGAGQAAIGRALGYVGEQAKRMGKSAKYAYFDRMPGVAGLIRQVSQTAEIRGYIFNWLGRVLQYGRDTAYKSTNGLIQSGVGDMTKVAMVEIDTKILVDTESKMILQVHDAILFQMVRSELHLIPEIIKTMTGVYPHKILPMQADAMYSDKSWGDLQETVPPVA